MIESAVEDDNVFVLSSKNFDDFISSNEFTVGKFSLIRLRSFHYTNCQYKSKL
jgi:hypothetical protein